MRNKPNKIATLALIGAILALQGCNDDDNNETENETTTATAKVYRVVVSNLTHNQPFSPLASVIHNNGYHAYSLGSTADSALETLAEGGDNSALLSAADADSRVIDTASGSSSSNIAPGANETLILEGLINDPRLTLVTMPINTNDAFIALDAIDLSELVSGESLVLYARAYDAGTEGNSEAATDVPGQGGEGFNTLRNDRDFVSIHPGIVSMDDGLTESALDQSHRFDNPAAKIVVTRTQ
ncbi:MAG: hypothetical protein GXP14_05970 [Gammaproteobacteria bacterium]|nr:hypothetical protein [Gammaproteobacteria bacterium]